MSKKLIIVMVLVTLSACDSKKNNQVTQSPSQPDVVEASEPQEEMVKQENSKLCPNGETPEVIKGECTGRWVVGKSDGEDSCNFDWGPTIECPDGMTGMNYKSVCYGTTSKPSSGQATAKDCETKFGKFPISPSYELLCCPS